MIRAFQWDLARQTEREDWLAKQLPRYAEWGYQEVYLHLEDAVEFPSLPGVARKTGNVVLGSWYGIAVGVVVDTHVMRLSKRLELTKESAPEKVEQDLMKIIPQDRWIAFSHELIHHGRQICVARKPRCVDCTLEKLCNSSDKTWSSH